MQFIKLFTNSYFFKLWSYLFLEPNFGLLQEYLICKSDNNYSKDNICIIIIFMFVPSEEDPWVNAVEHLCFTLPLPSTHKHSEIYLQLWIRDEYHILLITSLLTTRFLLDEIHALLKYHLIDWWWNVKLFLFTWLINYRFLLKQFDETSGFELASNITLV